MESHTDTVGDALTQEGEGTSVGAGLPWRSKCHYPKQT